MLKRAAQSAPLDCIRTRPNGFQNLTRFTNFSSFFYALSICRTNDNRGIKFILPSVLEFVPVLFNFKNTHDSVMKTDYFDKSVNCDTI